MAVSVILPHKKDKKDPMDTIAKGLQLAATVYGIKDAREKAEFLKQQQGIENKQKDRELDIKEIEANKPKGTGTDPLVSALRMQQLEDARRRNDEARAKTEFDKSVEGRQAKLGSDGKQRLDNAKLGLVSVQGMADALNAGNNTFSFVGDNDFTQQRALFEESLGRMQSGGAISKEEENRFKKMAPTFWDSPEMRTKKLANLQQEFSARIGTLGFQPEELGIQKTDVALKPPAWTGGFSTPQANAAPVKQPSAEDIQALEWAKANPKDPRASAIMKANGL
jgi:hypothetical protein